MASAQTMPGPDGWGDADAHSPDTAEQLLRDLGLTGYQARVLLALDRLGPAPAAHLTVHAQVPRTSVYPVLEELRSKSLVRRMSGARSATWSALPLGDVLSRLNDLEAERLAEAYAADRERLLRLRELSERVKQTRLETRPAYPATSLPFVDVVPTPAELAALYSRLLGEATTEVLVMNRGPYLSHQVVPAVLEMCARGVSSRALYSAVEVEHPEYAVFQASLDAYHAAGVTGRVVDEVPVRMAIIDRRSVLLALEDAAEDSTQNPTLLHVHHPAFAIAQVVLFDAYWSQGRAYRTPGNPAADTEPGR